MKEIWKTIQVNTNYLVSSTGLIKNKNTNKVRKEYIDHKGYSRVSLSGKSKTTSLVHRLVAMAFISNENNYPIVNHLDFNRSNNNVENLEWCTVSKNNEYTAKNGRMNPNSLRNLVNYLNPKLNRQDAELIRKLRKEGYTTTKLGNLFGVYSATISKICLNQRYK